MRLKFALALGLFGLLVSGSFPALNEPASLAHAAKRPAKRAAEKRPPNRAKAKAGRTRARSKAKADKGTQSSSTRSGPSRRRSPFAAPPQSSPLLPVEAPTKEVERPGPAPSRTSVRRHAAAPAVVDTPLSLVERRLVEALSFQVTANGPYQPWIVQLQNTGSEAIPIVSDARLLWFEATVPGKRKPITCRLPSALLPREAYPEQRVLLEPGDELAFHVDPRFYCFEAQDTSFLVPGTYLKPHYGWPTKTQTRWQGGKPKEIRLQQTSPFMAVGDPLVSDGLKEVTAPGIALGDEYAVWSKTRILAEDKVTASHAADTGGGLELLMVRGDDAYASNDLSVQIAVRNRSLVKRRVHLRADQLSFLVWGPSGALECSPPVVFRAPDSQSLTTLAPGERIQMNVRLSEFCPNGTFDRPGFYYVSAQLPQVVNFDDRGRPLGNAFEQQPANDPLLRAIHARPVRVQTGDGTFNYWDVGPALTEAFSVAPLDLEDSEPDEDP